MSEVKFTFTWHIENYFLCGLETGKYIESSTFVDSSVFRNRWSLRLYPRGCIVTCKGFCSLFLHRCSEGEDINIDYKVEILKKDGDILKYNYSSTNEALGEFYILDFIDFIKIDDLAKEFISTDAVTVRCHIITDEPCEDRCATGCVATTRIGVDNFSFHWDIKNSNDWSEPKTFPFSTSSLVESSWKFTDDVLNLRIKKVNDDENSRFIQCNLILLDKSYREFSSKMESFLFTSENNEWDMHSFVTNILLKENERLLLHNNGFNLVKCEITISNGCDSKAVERYIYPKLSNLSSSYSGDIDPVPALLSVLNDLFVNKKHADIQLQVGGEVISAHKCILASSSPVFSAMFDSDMAENRSGVVKIDDVDCDIMNDMMEFLYTGKVNVKMENALKLLVAADKYQVPTLTAKCSSFLKSTLSPDNACETAAGADLVGCSDLKNAAIHYIKAHAGSILATEMWFEWVDENFKLGSEIIRQLSVDFANTANKNFN